MKRMLVLLSCLLTAGITANAQPVKQHGRLHVQGTQLTDEHNSPVVLRGMSFGWSCFHPRFYTAGSVKWLHNDWHCTVVRAAMGIEPKGGYKDDSATAIAKIRTVVDAAIKEGIYVIIDWHSHNINLAEARRFFAEMALAYHQYPNVLYEVFNEPDHETWNEVKAYATDIISTIRTYDSSNVILVGSPHWDQYVHLPAADPITGYSNLMYTLHYYAATHKQSLRDRADSALNKGLPIFISESAGMEASGNGPLDLAEWQRWRDWAEQHKLSWITWSVSDKNETCSVLQTSAASDGRWSQKDLKESGIRTRQYLRKYKAGSATTSIR